MTIEKIVAAWLMLVSLMLPGVFSGLPFGASLAKVLGGLGLMVLMAEILRAMVNRRLPVVHGASRTALVTAFLLFVLYSIASAKALFSGNTLVVDSARVSVLVNFLIAGPAFSAVWLLYRRDRANLLRNVGFCLCAALTILLMLELIMIVIGIRHQAYADTPQTKDSALLLSLAGLQINRVLLPISSGVNNGAVLASAGFLMAILFLGRTSHKLWAYLCLAPVSLILLLLNDTRSFIIATVVAVMMGLMMFKRAKWLPLIIVLLPLLPPLATVFSAALSPLVGGFASARYSSFGMFSGREFIWGMAFNEWLTGASPLAKLFGSGLYGQVSTGLSSGYSELFLSFSDAGAELASLHNSYLQAAADVGLVGLAVLVLLLGALARQLARLVQEQGSNGLAGAGLLAVLVTITMAAGTEVCISPYSKESIAVLAIVFSVSVLATASSIRVRTR